MKLWGGRFSGETDKEVEKFSTSIHVDQRLWRADLVASTAHARMLGKIGVLTEAESRTLIKGLEEMLQELEQGKLSINLNAEDVHSDMEVKLRDKVGAVSGKLHTARSRNDQVATDLRLYLRWEVTALMEQIRLAQVQLLELAQNHTKTILPGFTHMQHAQPVSLAHHLLAYFWMFDRDRERLQDGLKRLNLLPLGSAALAGTGFPLDREMVAKELGFVGLCENSLDAVSDRDFAVEFLASASLLATHLSRFCEEMILWSTPEFGFVQMSDAVTTGSSIMPQKKNPDVAELVRGKTGRVVGSLVGMLVLLKGLPLSYNRDLQEDKQFVWDGLDTARSCVRMFSLMLDQTHWKADRMRAALKGDFSNATDLADDLVKKGLPFREAHEVVGQVVHFCESNKRILEELTLSDLKTIHSLFDAQSIACLSHDNVLGARLSRGGTSPQSVVSQIEIARSRVREASLSKD